MVRRSAHHTQGRSAQIISRGRPRGQVEVLGHAAHRHRHGGDVRRGRRRVVRPDQAEDAEHADHGEADLHQGARAPAGAATTVASRPIADRSAATRAPTGPRRRGSRPPGVGVDGAPLPVPDQLAEVVPPAVVGRRGVAVPEVAVVPDQQQPRARPAPWPRRPPTTPRRPPAPPSRVAHGLTAARNTEEPNGRSRWASTRSSQPAQTQQRPLDARARPRARRRRRPAGRVRRASR